MNCTREKNQDSLHIHLPMKGLAALLAIIWPTEPYAGGTSIAIIANKKEIVVAADSKVYGSDEKICKIFKVGSVFWAMSGLMDNSATGYNVAEIVKESYVPGKSVEQLLKVFMKNVSVPLGETMIHYYHFPKRFEIIRHNPLEIAFWSFEGGTPVIAYVSYRVTVLGDHLTVAPYDRQIVKCSDQRRADAIVLGVKDRIPHYLETHPSWWQNLAPSAHSFVAISIKESPQSVGYPINELIIHRDGTYHWAEPNKYCRGRLCEGPPPEPIASR